MPVPLADELARLVLHRGLGDHEPQRAALLVVHVDHLLLAGDPVADIDRRVIVVVLLAVQDQADIDVEQAQQAALARIVVGDGLQEGRRHRHGAVARPSGGGLVDVDRVFLADGLAEQLRPCRPRRWC